MPQFSHHGSIPCVTQDEESGEVLMLGYMNRGALSLTIKSGFAHYLSRARQRLWAKGKQSGQSQQVQRILIDDDQDCLLLKVWLTGGASCHVGHRSCFYRQLNVRDRHTDFGLEFVEALKVFYADRACGTSANAPR